MKNHGIILISLIVIFFIPELHAKDFASSLRGLNSELTSIMQVAAPVALIAASCAFFFSKQMGFGMLSGVAVGIILFASSNSLFQLVYRIFG